MPTDHPTREPGRDAASASGEFRTASARRVTQPIPIAGTGSGWTAWARQLDDPSLIERLLPFVFVVLVGVQPGGYAAALPMLMGVVHPRVPSLAAAGAGGLVWFVLAAARAPVVGQPEPSLFGLLVAFLVGSAAMAAAFARAIEIPTERVSRWWLPFSVLAAATAASSFFVFVRILDAGGGGVVGSLVRQAVRANPGLCVWPAAMAAVLVFLPAPSRRFALPAAAVLAIAAGAAASGGFRFWDMGGSDLMIRGRPVALEERVMPQVLYQKRHVFGRFRPSILRVAPDGRGHALGSIVTARRGAVYEWRVFPARGGEPFILEANDIAFIGPDQVLALTPAGKDYGHTGFELRLVSAAGNDELGFKMPLLLQPGLRVDLVSQRWAVSGRKQDLVGRIRGRTETGFVMRLDDGNAVVDVAPETAFLGVAGVDELEPGLWVEVVMAGPGVPATLAAKVTALGTQAPDRSDRPSTMYQQTGTYGLFDNASNTWMATGLGSGWWTPIDDHHALVQVQTDEGGRAFTGEAVTRLDLEQSSRPQFELVEVTRSFDQRTIASFEIAVVCKASAVDPGIGICTASDDRTQSVWLATVGEDGIDLDPVVAFQSSFMSPALVTRAISVLTGPMSDPVVVDHATGRAGNLDLPSGVVPVSLVPLGDRRFAALVTVDEADVAVVYSVPSF